MVVSDEIAVLWGHLVDHHGFGGFVARAPEQFLRWESRYGWTRSGWGAISERESGLTEVLTRILSVPDTWVTFTEHYLQVLDGLAPPPPPPPPSSSAASARGRAGPDRAGQRRREPDQRVARRAETMIEWHLMLVDRFAGTDDEALLDRLADHPALGGPEQTYFRARLARARGDLPAARQLIQQALERLPGHSGYLALASQIDAPLPAAARAVAASRRLPGS